MSTTTDASAGDATDTAQRGVSELLELGTYQGMTDAEIESLLNYRVAMTVSEKLTSANSDFQTMCNELSESNASIRQNLDEICANVISFIPTYESVTLYDVNGKAVTDTTDKA